MSADPFIGEVIMFAGNFAPRGWALCDGQLIPISQNSALFSILGTTYGGDGRTTFALPDLRGRSPMHAGSGPGLSQLRLGQRGGAETVTLSANNLPAHAHQLSPQDFNLNVADSAASESEPTPNFSLGAASIYSDKTANTTVKGGQITGTTSNTGGGQAINTQSPYLGINFIIALVGIYPSRS